MKKGIIYLLIKLIFSKSKFKSIMKSFPQSEVVEWMEKAIKEENYEPAAFLKYYIEFKYSKEKPKLQL
jgi:hypothetical protein